MFGWISRAELLCWFGASRWADMVGDWVCSPGLVELVVTDIWCRQVRGVAMHYEDHSVKHHVRWIVTEEALSTGGRVTMFDGTRYLLPGGINTAKGSQQSSIEPSELGAPNPFSRDTKGKNPVQTKGSRVNRPSRVCAGLNEVQAENAELS